MNKNLAKYDMKQLLRNPALIHRIQDNLLALKGDGFFTAAIRKISKNNIKGAIRLIVESYPDNPTLIKEIVGKETLDMIEEHEGITLADDIKDIF